MSEPQQRENGDPRDHTERHRADALCCCLTTKGCQQEQEDDGVNGEGHDGRGRRVAVIDPEQVGRDESQQADNEVVNGKPRQDRIARSPAADDHPTCEDGHDADEEGEDGWEFDHKYAHALLFFSTACSRIYRNLTNGFLSLLVSLSLYNVREQVQIRTRDSHEQHEDGWKFVPFLPKYNYF